MATTLARQGLSPASPLAPVPAGPVPAPELLVVVQRDWNGWLKAMAPISALEEVHWRQPAGAPKPLIHAYVRCDALVSGMVPHDCSEHGSGHRLLVCVLKCHTAPIAFQQLADLASLQPPR